MAMVETHDVIPVRSRVSWGAIFAGAVVAVAVHLLLGVLGVALGLSAWDRVGGQELGIGAAIWAVLTVLFALFLGGWTASQCTAGENKLEAVIYGLLVWGAVLGLLLWLTTAGIRLGFSAVMGLASTPAATAADPRFTDADLRAAGFTEEQIADLRGPFDRLRQRDLPADVRSIAADPRTTAAAWWTFAGIALSVLASVGGALAGAGPTLAFGGLSYRATSIRTEQVPPARERVER